ncbi:MAG: hypothetical protein AAGA75_11655 [Cyanobacteria bacterium P01_E01_bin.6]
MKLVLKATLAIAAIACIISGAAMAFQPRPDQNGVPNDTVAGGSRYQKELDDRGSGRNKHHRPDRPIQEDDVWDLFLFFLLGECKYERSRHVTAAPKSYLHT